MQTEQFSHIGQKTPNVNVTMNEDRIFISENILAVIDGATSSSGAYINELSDGAYIAEFFKNSLNDFNNSELSAKQILSQINKEFGEHLKAEHPDIFALGKQGPMASGVIVKLTNDKSSYSFAQVGDCMLLELKNDKLNELTNDSRYEDDNKYTEQARKLSKDSNVSIFEIRKNPNIMQAIQQHRLESNVKKGVLNGEIAVDKFICHGENSLQNVNAFVLMSDGMAQPKFELKLTYIKAAEHMLEQGIENYYAEIKRLFNADNDLKNIKYPRLKHIDDASAVVARF